MCNHSPNHAVLGENESPRRQINGHTLELRECDWKCLQCGHWFDAADDAKAFWCGDPCEHGRALEREGAGR